MIKTVAELIETLKALPQESFILVDLRPVESVTKDPKSMLYNIEPYYSKCEYCHTRVRKEGVTTLNGVAHVSCWNKHNPNDKR